MTQALLASLSFFFIFLSVSPLLPFSRKNGSKKKRKREKKESSISLRDHFLLNHLKRRENFPSDSIIVAIPFSTLLLSFLSSPFSRLFLLFFFFLLRFPRNNNSDPLKPELTAFSSSTLLSLPCSWIPSTHSRVGSYLITRPGDGWWNGRRISSLFHWDSCGKLWKE